MFRPVEKNMEQLKQDVELLSKATALLNVPLQTHADLRTAIERLWKAAQPQAEQSAQPAAEPAQEAPHPQQEMAATAAAPVPGKRRGRPPGTKNGVAAAAAAA